MTFAKRCALALALILALSLTACSGSPVSPKNPVSITIWHYYNGAQKRAFDNLVAEFNETDGFQQGITVEAFSQGSVNDLTTKIIDSANKKVGAEPIPDIFAAYADTAMQVDKLGLVAELDAYLTDEDRKDYVPEFLAEGYLGGEHLKIFPTAKSTEILMLNHTDWEPFAAAAGVSVGDLQTFEGITETARKYYEWTDSQTTEPDDGKAFFGRDAVANYFLIGAKQLGVELFHVENGSVQFQLDESVLKRMWDNFYVPFVHGWFTAGSKFRADDAKLGDIIALVGSTSGAAYFPDEVTTAGGEAYPIECEILPAPYFEGGEKITVQQGAGMVVIKSDEAREYASVQFLKWFTDPERNIAFSASSGYLPVKESAYQEELLEAAFQQQQEAEFSGNLKNTLRTAFRMRKDYTYYTNQAFDGGTAARGVLENSMLDWARKDLEQIQQLVQDGSGRAEAADSFCTEENFQNWFGAFQQALQKTIP